jgi:hypothetical protein
MGTIGKSRQQHIDPSICCREAKSATYFVPS